MHPAKYIDTALKVAGLETTYRNVGSRLAAAKRELPTLWLALPTSRWEEQYAFIYMRKPTIADVGQKIHDFYTKYTDMSDPITENGPMGGLVYPEGAQAAEDSFQDLDTYDDEELCVVLLQFGS